MLDEKRRGEIAEHLIVYEALKAGLQVSKPCGDSYLYDLIFVTKELKPLLVQIKSRSVKDSGRTRYRFTIMTGQRKEVKYTGIDIFALVTPDDYYIIPYSEIEHLSQVSISDDNQTYDKYKNNFNAILAY